MKKVFLLYAVFFILASNALAQNVGIGTAEPYNKLQVSGSFVVTLPSTATTTAPTVAQTKTMVNASTISFIAGDSTGRIYDPGGPAGNYIANITANANIVATSCIGIEVVAESMNLGTGDSLIIKESSTGRTLMAVGNNYNVTGKWILNAPSLYIIFKSDADANVGSGFALLFRRLYDNSSQVPAASGYAGSSLVFDVKTSSLQSGLYTNAPGNYAAAFGSSTIASGNGAAAFGRLTTAGGNNAFATGNASNAAGYASIASGDGAVATGYGSSALGVNTSASGNYSFASGFGDTASGISAIAMGSQNKAPADYTVAIGSENEALANYTTAVGFNTTASGDYATAMGSIATASGANALALGYFSFASGQKSIAIGEGANASNLASLAIGTSTTSSGISSTAIGNSTDATAYASTAMGIFTTASGDYSTAMGRSTTASGLNSTAIGNNASTNNQTNSLAIGGTGAATVCNSPNQFMARFDNYTFFVTPSSYAYLIPSSNGWAYTSDKNKKEKFEELDGEAVLQKMAGIPLYSWNFKDSKPYRHYGIMAQDFYTAFGKDSYGTIGNDTTVSSLDLIGVAYSAIKALEKRTAEQQAANTQLKNENLALQRKLSQFEAKLNELLAIKEKEQEEKTGVAAAK